ncbi:MAG TPA: YIP1 family protein [Thermomicrobiales bacterium]|nr:YIP1 family protein [Thermomicrobiales bacterium]
MQATGTSSLTDRMMGALRLNPTTYEEVEHDRGATSQALLIVVLAAIASAIGGASEGLGGLIAGVLASLLGWAVYSGLVYVVGTRVLGTSVTSASWQEVARTMGFAYTPQLLAVFGFIPILGWILVLVGFIWFLVASIVAIRHALDMSTGRAVGTALIALVGYIIIAGIVAAIFGIGVSLS